jgi:hypothetical protein
MVRNLHVKVVETGKRTDLDGSLAITELAQFDFGRFLPQAFADGVDELGVRRPGKDASLVLLNQPFTELPRRGTFKATGVDT